MAFEPTDDEIRQLVEEKKPLPADYRKRLVLKAKTGHKEQQLDMSGADGSDFRDFRGALDCMFRERGFDVPEDPQANLMEIMGVQ